MELGKVAKDLLEMLLLREEGGPEVEFAFALKEARAGDDAEASLHGGRWGERGRK